jgi:hypothetical protein
MQQVEKKINLKPLLMLSRNSDNIDKVIIILVLISLHWVIYYLHLIKISVKSAVYKKIDKFKEDQDKNLWMIERSKHSHQLKLRSL